MKVFIQILSSHCTSQGDGGWLCITLACYLVIVGLKEELSTGELIRGLNYANDIAVEELMSSSSSVSLTLDWSESSHIVSVLLSIFRPHQSSTSLTNDEMEDLARTLLSAFIGSLSDGSDGCLSPRLVFHKTLLTPDIPEGVRCHHYEGILFFDIPLPRLFPRNGSRDVLVAVFEQSLEIPEQSSNISIECHNTSTSLYQKTTEKSIISVKDLEYNFLNEMCDVFVRSNVGLVCCQRRIHPHLQRILSLKGVLCIPRLSIRYINAMLKLSGAKQMGGFPHLQTLIKTNSTKDIYIERSSLGYLHRVHVQSFGSKSFIAVQQSVLYGEESASDEVVENEDIVLIRLLKNKLLVKDLISRRVKYSTVLLIARQEYQCREMEYICAGAIRVLSQLINTSNPAVLPGGGCWLSYLAHHVRNKISNLKERNSIINSCRFQDINDLDIDEEMKALIFSSSSVTRGFKRAAMLYCNALEHIALIAGGSENLAMELKSILETETTIRKKGDISLKHFIWPTELETSVSGVFRYENANGCVITAYHNADEGKRTVQQADALDSLSSMVSALQVSMQAFSTIIDIDGVLI